jgi:hypothetical protein
MVTNIIIAAGDYSHGIQKRKLGKLNYGTYCECGEFVAFVVYPDPKIADEVAFACDGPISFSCPFCRNMQKRVVTEFESIVLTEGNKRKAVW